RRGEIPQLLLGEATGGCFELFLLRREKERNGHRCDPLANVLGGVRQHHPECRAGPDIPRTIVSERRLVTMTPRSLSSRNAFATASRDASIHSPSSCCATDLHPCTDATRSTE